MKISYTDAYGRWHFSEGQIVELEIEKGQKPISITENEGKLWLFKEIDNDR